MIRITQRSGSALYNQVALAKRCYFPAGTYTLSAPLVPTEGIVWEGDGDLNTIFNIVGNISAIKPACAGAAARLMYATIKGIGINGISGNTVPLVDFRNVSYAVLEDLRLLGNGMAAPIIQQTSALGQFLGYNSLRRVYAIGGTIGYEGGGNQIMIEGGQFNTNSQWGIKLVDANFIALMNPDVSGNGGAYATYTGTYPTGYYSAGGIFADNVAGLFGRIKWFEENAQRINGLWSPNDVECTSTCSGIDIKCNRWDNAYPGKIHGYGLDYGQDYGYGTPVKTLLTGATEGSHLDGTWVAVNCAMTAASALPAGVVGDRLTASSLVPKYYTELLSYAECQKHVGKKVVAKFWVNAVNSPWPAGECRVGISALAGGALPAGNYISSASERPGPHKMTHCYTILGTETNGLRFGVEFTASGSTAAELGNVDITLNRLD